MSLVEQELPTLPEHLSSPPVFSGVRVGRSLVLCVCFVDRCLSFCPVSFGHCAVCPSSIYGFWLPLWYLRYTDSDYPFGILGIRILITPLVYLIHVLWLPLWYLWSMSCDYTFGILDLCLVITPLISLIYVLWLPLWYLRFMSCDYPFGILDLCLVITPLIS